MKKRYIFVLLAAVLMAWGCQEEIDSTKGKVVPTPGADVKFGASLAADVETKTIYGTESNNAFPILWLSGDQVFIASPQCRENSNEGTFSVPSEANNRDYAGSFTKVSGAVQWGATAADFYSIYPQREGAYEVKTASGFSATNATFELNMPSEQTCVVAGTTPVMTTADMNACFMYAKQAGVANGTSPVTLKYTPLSTAIRFKLQGPETAGTLTISRIRLIGPSGAALSGQFQVKLDGNSPVVTPVSGKTSNIVTIFAQYEGGAYLQLSSGQSIELNAFIIPVSGLAINENWKLEVTLADGKQVTKTLKPSSTTANTSLVAGKIHRLGNMPKLPNADLSPATWMAAIPRNVYLSEISIPGSWNSLNPDFQTMSSAPKTTAAATTVIDGQYAVGARLFHLDTRFRTNVSGIPTRLEKRMTLSIANGGATETVTNSGGQKVMDKGESPDFTDVLTAITNNVKDNEYITVICTFAQNSFTPTKQGSSDYSFDNYWYDRISDACASNGKVINASSINANTT
ncbi:MAG: fimbrillin family protein, partial [Bacteroidales bacterium]|nr:fimbrillin family protein [Bacteroidales bacterium]